jgi:hypothetical protein
MDKIGKNDLVRRVPCPLLPMPRNMRGLFNLLAQYDQQEGFDGLIGRLDMTGVKSSDIYRVAHQRAPEKVDAAMDRLDFDPHKALLAALLSNEFRRDLLRNLLASYPEKRRDVYFHVPKCAGTDLTLNLAPRRASLPALIGENGTNEEALIYISMLCRSLHVADDLFIYGHIQFGSYVDQAGVRFGDRFFTVIRDPIDLMISQVSDALSQVLREPNAKVGDSRIFLDFLGLDSLPSDPSPAFTKALWVQGLLDPRIAQPNRICTHLGRGMQATYQAAITNIVTNDIEITTVPNYSRWLLERWNLNVSTRHNASERYLYPSEVRRHLIDRIWPAIAEDEKLYRVVNWALRKSGQTSITGQQILQLAGSRLLDELPNSLMEVTANEDGTDVEVEPADLVAVQKHHHIARFLVPLPEFARGSDTIKLELDFGHNGNARLFTQKGWAGVEREFTWTNAQEAKLSLPRPTEKGDLLFQAMASPFRYLDQIPLQSIEMLVNGTSVARGKMKEPAILECRIPWSLISDEPKFEITFRLPDAACPADLGMNMDQRLLGAAFRWAKLFSLSDSRFI